MRSFFAVFHARNMEFLRDRSTLIFNVAFPFFLIFGLAFAFSGNGGAEYKVGVLGNVPEGAVTTHAVAGGAVRAAGNFYHMPSIDFVPYKESKTALERLRHRQIDLVIDFPNRAYYINKESNKSLLAEKLFLAYGEATGPSAIGVSSTPVGFVQKQLTGRGVRYVDWFVPGAIGMNLGFLALFGVGFVIVRYRKNGVLKRLKATPIKPLQFVGAQAASRFVIVIVTSVIVFGGSDIFLKFLMLGSYWNLLLLTAVTVICMIALGLVFAARFKSEELTQGLMNLILWPMMAFSGVFFSLEGGPPILKSISEIFPLTHYLQAARAVMLDGAGFVQIAPDLLALTGMTVLFLTIASLLFKWE